MSGWLRSVSLAVCLCLFSCFGLAEMRAQPPRATGQHLNRREGTVAQQRAVQIKTKHEGMVWYVKFGGHWYREHAEVTLANDYFFGDYEVSGAAVNQLLRDAGYTGRGLDSERDRWQQIGRLWTFLRATVRPGNKEELSPLNRWPSLSEYARFYQQERQLAWHACFSKAHLFSCLLGRMMDRDRLAIVTAHHTEAGAPPTASHVFVAVHIADQWYYLDPAAVFSQDFPPFENRRSIGVPSMTSVDYEHPYKILLLPGSKLARVPLLASSSQTAAGTSGVDRTGDSGRRPLGSVPQWKRWDTHYQSTMRRLARFGQGEDAQPWAAEMASRLTEMRHVLLKAQQMDTQSGSGATTDIRRERNRMHQQFLRLAGFPEPKPDDPDGHSAGVGSQALTPSQTRQILDAAHGLRTVGLEILRDCAKRSH